MIAGKNERLVPVSGEKVGVRQKISDSLLYINAKMKAAGIPVLWPTGWSKESKIAMLKKQQKILEAKLEFIRKIKENMKKEMGSKKNPDAALQKSPACAGDFYPEKMEKMRRPNYFLAESSTVLFGKRISA